MLSSSARLTDFTAKRIASPGVRSASHAHRAMQSDPRGRLTDFTAKRIASAGMRERPIGISDSHRSGEAVRGRERPCVRGRERPCVRGRALF